MAVTSGASHALAAFSTVLLGAFLKIYLETYSGLIRTATEGLGGLVTAALGVPVSAEIAGVAIVAALLSFLWGVGYHKARH